ncbi:unnamed protein product [Pedinophyceae sp. YPF-701]|nr:unnamed protein product [Pedinophyceae sp. YPF-701]
MPYGGFETGCSAPCLLSSSAASQRHRSNERTGAWEASVAAGSAETRCGAAPAAILFPSFEPTTGKRRFSHIPRFGRGGADPPIKLVDADPKPTNGGFRPWQWFRLPGQRKKDFEIDLSGPGDPAQGLMQWMARNVPFMVNLTPHTPNNKAKLMDVRQFFQYVEKETVRLFQSLDSDGDGEVTIDDLKYAASRRGLPEEYARILMRAGRKGQWWRTSLTYEDFHDVLREREQACLCAYTALDVDQEGKITADRIRDMLETAGVRATEANTRAMLRVVNPGAADAGSDGLDGEVSYGRFRDLFIFMPTDALRTTEPTQLWYDAATTVPLGPPVEADDIEKDKGPGRTQGRLLLRAALAGGIASGSSTLLMHPLDTLKTRLQATAGATIGEVVRSAPKIGPQGLYRGIIPAVTGTALGHGMRTFSYEAALGVLLKWTHGAAELQMQGLASGLGTVVGTAIRIPCEVMKQRLQVARHQNVVEAVRVALQTEGPRGMFRGTPALLGREVPFYALGMVVYEQMKGLFNGRLFTGNARELKPWECIAIGALSGAATNFVTMPMDVLKTRLMTAPAGASVSALPLLVHIVKNEGVRALWKGSIARAIWIAPQGAMNFSGYELAKRALDKRASQKADEQGGAAETAGEGAKREKPRERGAGAAEEGGGGGDALEGVRNVARSLVVGLSRLRKRPDESGDAVPQEGEKGGAKGAPGSKEEAAGKGDKGGLSRSASDPTGQSSGGDKGGK